MGPHPADFRWRIMGTALVAVVVWWGLGLPYSLFSWVLDDTQRRWVLFCYAWEVPAAGGLGPVLVPLLWLRRIERAWDAVFGGPASADPRAAAALERALLDYPVRVGWVVLLASILGYAVGALQLRLFAQLPASECIKVCLTGVVTGLVGGLVAYLYLVWLLPPLLERVSHVRADTRPAARRIPLYAKVFAGSLILTFTALALLGMTLYSSGERILEDQLGQRLVVQVRQLARELDGRPSLPADRAWWLERAGEMGLGPSGYVTVVDGTGALVAEGSGARRWPSEGFRPATVERVRSLDAGFAADRVYAARLVAFAPLDRDQLRVVAVVERAHFGAGMASMRRRGMAVFVVALALALLQGFLFSRGLMRPIETVTRAATEIAQTPKGPWHLPVVRTDDEVGELAAAQHEMILRLEQGRRELEHERLRAEDANHAKDEFLSVLSHELRTPLTPILAWVRLLLDNSADPEFISHGLEVIERNVRLQGRLIDDLLDVSRIAAGKLHLVREPVDLEAVIDAALESTRPAAAAKRVRLDTTREGAPADTVVGDPERLQQVVRNLLANAVKFTPAEGHVGVWLAYDHAAARIAIRDTGRGIAPDVLPHVFEPFWQADRSSTRPHGGLGLGLAIVRELVHLHGGTVHAASEGEGRGAEFTVTLPYTGRRAAVDGAARGERRVAQAPSLVGARVLIVDDDPDTRELLERVLTTAGADTRQASSVGEALEALSHFAADALVSDIGMAGADGYALLRAIRERERRAGTSLLPAIALTAYARVEDREQALAAGFQVHLAKPLEPADLLAAVADVTGRTR